MDDSENEFNLGNKLYNINYLCSNIINLFKQIVLSLNHANANIRSNALDFILKKLTTSKKDAKSSLNSIDEKFVREQMEMKFSNESSPRVLESLLNFDTKLTSYFSLEELVDNEDYLLKLFRFEIIPASVDLKDKSPEMIEYLQVQNKSFLACRCQVIDLIFNSLYKTVSFFTLYII